MSKIIFYESDVASLVEDFMKTIRTTGATKANFINDKDIEERTKISKDAELNMIATALTSIAGLIDDLMILYPCNKGLEEVVKDRIDREDMKNITITVLRFKSENSINIKDIEYINLNPNTTKITENTFIPEVKKLLYLMTLDKASKILNNATYNSSITITSIAELASYFNYDETMRLSIAIPQLSTGSWVEFFKAIEFLFEKEPIDAVYMECENKDYFINLMCDVIHANFADNDVKFFQSEKSYIKIVENKPEEETSNN